VSVLSLTDSGGYHSALRVAVEAPPLSVEKTNPDKPSPDIFSRAENISDRLAKWLIRAVFAVHSSKQTIYVSNEQPDAIRNSNLTNLANII
jgi:hypothetical protein